MSDLQFRSRSDARDVTYGRSSAGGWLIFAGAALAVIVLGLVIASAPAPEPAALEPATPEVAAPEAAPAAPVATQ